MDGFVGSEEKRNMDTKVLYLDCLRREKSLLR